MKSKLEILDELIKELSDAGDLVIDLTNETGQELYLVRERTGVAHYKLTVVPKEKLEEIRQKHGVGAALPLGNWIITQKFCIEGTSNEII